MQKKSRSKPGLLDLLSKRTVLGAEGYIFELERRGYVKAGAYVPEVILDYPNAVKELHREFLLCGSDVMVALTYYAHRKKLQVIGREHELEKMNRQAVRMANEIAKEGNALVAGNICNTWAYDPDKKETHKAVAAMYDEQLAWAVEEGIDFVIAETIEYLGEALIALERIKKLGLPAVVTFAPSYEKTKDGYDWVDACVELEKAGADVVGFNCMRGPATMMPLLKKARKKVKGYMAAQPVPYSTSESLPAFLFLKDPNGDRAFPVYLDPYLLSRAEMARFAKDAQDLGINYIGICCGAGPHHVRAMAEAIGLHPKASKYSPDISTHGLLGDAVVVGNHEKKHLKNWK